MTRDAFLAGLVAGDQHRGGIRCLRLFRLTEEEFAGLRREVAELQRRRRPSSVADPGHVTSWTRPQGEVLQYSLLNRSGRTDDFSADHDLSCRDKWFFDAAAFPLLGDLVAALPHLVNFRINLLGPGAALPAHEEHVPFRTVGGWIGARLRFHLPVQTNPRAELHLDGRVFHLEAGVAHLVNHGCVHAAANHGATSRVHLLWDALLTEDLYRLLFGSVPRPGWWLPIPEADREPTPLRSEPIPPYPRLPPAVSAAEAEQLALCEPQ